jgi:hypothetical protein
MTSNLCASPAAGGNKGFENHLDESALPDFTELSG